MEREAVSVRFFDNIKVEVVSSEEDGWSIIREDGALLEIDNLLDYIKLTSQRNVENTFL
jgi:hypothetical protein